MEEADRAGRAHRAGDDLEDRAGETRQRRGGPGVSFPTVSEGVRIAAVEAAVAAGLAPSTTRAPEGRPGDGELDALRAAGWPVDRSSTAASPALRRSAAATARPGSEPFAGEAWATPAVAPGTATQDGALRDGAPGDDPRPSGEWSLMDWTDPPTGQVPAVVLGDHETEGHPEIAGRVPRGPSWREGGRAWEEDDDLSFLAEPATEDGGRTVVPGPDDPFEFDFAGFEDLPAAGQRHAGPSEEDAAWLQLLAQPGEAQPAPAPREDGSARRRRRGVARRGSSTGRAGPADRAGAGAADPIGASPSDRSGAAGAGPPAAGASGPSAGNRLAGNRPNGPQPGGNRASAPPAGEDPTGERSTTVVRARRGVPPALARIATGVVAGGIALGCFAAGPLPTLVLVALLATLASGELLAALRSGGYRPAAPVALLATPALMVAAYLHGAAALPFVAACSLAATAAWLVADRWRTPAGRRAAGVNDLGATMLVIGWVGLLAAFAGALLAPSELAHRHGLAVLVAAVVLAVGNDIGAYVTGSRIGRHRLAPTISPGKSVEGLIGGTVTTLLLAGLVASRLHPLDVGTALVLGVVVCVLAPLGDLTESLWKRDLGRKDMSDLLPAHGGVLDRVDSLLLVLPAAFYLAMAFHLS